MSTLDTKAVHDEFREIVWHYYSHHKRSMPWRENTSLYYVLVSEIMLQQTQVVTVIPKFLAFIHAFPNFESLASADTQTLLTMWSGLGYNTRAIRLRECAKQLIQSNYTDHIVTVQELDALPGIGPATAAAIVAYSYNQPTVYIETNIRRVFIHHFFKDHTNIEDAQLLPLIQETLDTNNPREWYWALMDYGSYLKTVVPNPNRKSKQYTVQSKFEGSVRQVRGEILKRLQKGVVTTKQIEQEFKERGSKAIDGLVRDKILVVKQGYLKLL